MSDEIYQFKFFLRRISPMIWRRVLIRSDQSLSHLHEVIQVSLGWEDDHLYCFRIHGKDYGSAGALTGDEDEPLSALRLRPNQRFLYEYDFTSIRDIWQIDVRFEKALPAKPDMHYPHCLDGKRSGPPGDCEGAKDFVNRQYGIERQMLRDLADAFEVRDLEAMKEVFEENNFYSRQTLNQSYRKYFQESSADQRRTREVQIAISQ